MLTVSGFYLLTGTAWAWLAQFKLSILGQTLLMNYLFKGHIMVLFPQAGSFLYHCTLVLYRLESVCCCAYVDVKAKPSSTVLNQKVWLIALHLTQSTPKKDRSGTRIHSDICPHVLRSDRLRSCISPEHQQLSLSLCCVSFSCLISLPLLAAWETATAAG